MKISDISVPIIYNMSSSVSIDALARYDRQNPARIEGGWPMISLAREIDVKEHFKKHRK